MALAAAAGGGAVELAAAAGGGAVELEAPAPAPLAVALPPKALLAPLPPTLNCDLNETKFKVHWENRHSHKHSHPAYHVVRQRQDTACGSHRC